MTRLLPPSTVEVTGITKSTATLQWSEAPGAVAYRLYEYEVKPGNNVPAWNVLVDRVSGLSYVLDRFKQPNRTHAFAVAAVDASGNESARSTPVEVTLLKK